MDSTSVFGCVEGTTEYLIILWFKITRIYCRLMKQSFGNHYYTILYIQDKYVTIESFGRNPLMSLLQITRTGGYFDIDVLYVQYVQYVYKRYIIIL